MSDTLMLAGSVCGIGAAIFLVLTIAMFTGYRIPVLWKDRGGLGEKQIEETRMKNIAAANDRQKMNVFEELQSKAKIKNTVAGSQSGRLSGSLGTAARASGPAGTSLLTSASKPANPDFIIEKNIMFVSTGDVL